MTHLLTIAIPVFNREAYFPQALESALNQTQPVPVMVVDNASDKVDFSAILRPYARPGLTYHRNPRNLGMAGNWNRCIELCSTPYLLILHDDDFLERDYVARFLQVHRPGPTLYWGQCGIMNKEGKPIRQEATCHPEAYTDRLAWCLNNPAYVGIVFHRAKAIELGGFRASLKLTPDWDLWFRLIQAGPFLRVPGRAGWYRDYQDEKRETTRLKTSVRFWFYSRNQIKRNFSYMGARATYLNYLHAGRLPGGNARGLIELASKFSPRLLDYFIKVCALSSASSPAGRFSRLLLRIGGRRGLALLRRFERLRRPCRAESTGTAQVG